MGFGSLSLSIFHFLLLPPRILWSIYTNPNASSRSNYWQFLMHTFMLQAAGTRIMYPMLKILSLPPTWQLLSIQQFRWAHFNQVLLKPPLITSSSGVSYPSSCHMLSPCVFTSVITPDVKPLEIMSISYS